MSVTAALVTGVLVSVLYLVLMVLVRQDAMSEAQSQAAETARRMVVVTRADRLVDPIITEPDELAQVLDGNGRVVAASAVLAGQPPIPAELPDAQELRRDSRVCGYPRAGSPCMLATTIRTVIKGEPFTFIATVPEPGLVPQPLWALLFGGAAIATVVLRGVSMWRAVGRTLAPVNAIRAELDRIVSTADLNRRVPVPDRQDEIRQLAVSVNATLDRLARAVEQQRRFVSDVSHELRTPITGLRTGLETAALFPDDSDPAEVVEAALAATERLQNIVTDLLVLARRDAGIATETELFDLAILARQEVARRPRRVPISVKAESPVMVQANHIGISRVLTNLLDNAARHATSIVEVRVLAKEGDAVVEVEDDGEGIPAESHEQIFERFVRLDAGRRRDPSGSGLGLAISREIARDHHGSLGIADCERGTCFVLRLPVVPQT